jgi:diguanylate cyclase (GGDEF)-like protein
MLTLATVVKERRALEHQLRELSVTDALTGLANYRLLVDRLISEMVRSQRTGRPFALLLLDVDGLKRINDKFGHLTGSRALSRVGDALRAACRAMDTPARYGGDEFAVILPETDAAMAQRIAERIEDSLARDGQTPPVTVSIGVSMYPEHGETTEALLGAADETLYAVKARAKQLESREA